MPLPLIVLTNGRRDCLSQSIPSVREHLKGFTSLTVVDDSGDPAYREWIAEEFGAVPIPVGDKPCGYWQAMRCVWALARDSGAGAFWFHEDDFVLSEPLDLGDLATVLDDNPHLTQIALLRQAWFGNEHAHGGLIEALEAQGNRFEERTDGSRWWIEHRACFTGNPSLIPARTFNRPWPDGAWSESRFGRALFGDKAARGAYWGRRGDPPRVTHIGHERAGTDY
ncbi:hypothetical protein [Sphaerisporangium sp. TRM90804]|uniref:hypothetical protein n=1 Tax=Sphaerisporangium sp. TRM90804 TaxID=3031113 RepID=UPI002449112E|nr:hypothetical protein [Sphaerisporangium sp. TRM90804]MDH2424759.1 hypothetical protein [Sphaerisporangium sp. TRM90804]